MPDKFSGLTPWQLSIEEQKNVVRLAINIIVEKYQRGITLENPDDVKSHLQVLLADRKDEVFCMLFLDNRH